jgi:hypothetical protein
MLVLLALQLEGGLLSIKCAHCGGRHAKLETVRQCARDAGIDPKSPAFPKAQMWLPTTGPIKPVRVEPGKPAAGYYWVDANLVAKIRIPAEGRWKGRYFVIVCARMENSEKLIFHKKDRDDFLQHLSGNSNSYYMVRYGTNTGYCPACGGELNPAEKRVGYHNNLGPYGPACAEVVQGRYVIQGG